jgi:glutaredoxin 3
MILYGLIRNGFSLLLFSQKRYKKVNMILYKEMFPSPSSTGYTIYTKDKCPFCVRAKDLLDNKAPLVIECDAYLTDAGTREAFLSFIQQLNGGEPYKTFPMIFLDGSFVGGFSELRRLLILQERGGVFLDI